MTESNTEFVQDLYEASARGDTEAFFAALSDDIEWQGPNTDKVPGSGNYSGKEEVGQLWQELGETYDELSVEPDEFLEGQETVTVLGNTSGRAKETGNDFKVPFVHVWRFSDEGKAREVLALADTFELAKALGFAE